MSALADRLRRLQQQAGATASRSAALPPAAAAAPAPRIAPVAPAAAESLAAPAVPAAAATTGSRLEALRRLLAVRSHPDLPWPAPRGKVAASGGGPVRSDPFPPQRDPRAFATRTSLRPPDRTLPGTEITPGVRLHAATVESLAAPATHLDLRALGIDDAIDATRLKFFDTETTGLAGGTGTRAFMLGVGDWHDGCFRVRQLTLTTTGAEPAMLDAFAGWFRPDDVLVSYNGRCYDAPLLATRYRLARRDSPLPSLAHLDLLYPTRRRYRGVWENCRLATIERRLLGIVREDDLPGSEAPRAWRDWLRGGDATDLRRVGAHNHQDLVSLARLLLRLLEQEPQPATA